MKRKKDKSYRTPTYNLHLSVNMTDKCIIDWLAFCVGGKITCRKKHNLHWKPSYAWYLNGKNAILFIKQIYPHLKVKRLQAEIALKFGDTIQFQAGGVRKRLSSELNKYREQLKSDISILNHRGQ
jgi:hypothetical protein